MFFEKYFLTHLEEAIQMACEQTWGHRFDKYQVRSITNINMDGEETYLVVMHDGKMVAPITAYIVQTDELDADVLHADCGLSGVPKPLSPELGKEASGEGLYVVIDQCYGYFVNEEALVLGRAFLEEQTEEEDESE